MIGSNHNEVWRDIEGADGYQVSDHGNVRVASRNGTWRHIRGEKTHGGYRCIRVQRPDGSRRKIYIHRAVLFAFRGRPPYQKADARHLDGNGSNNALRNLEWGTRFDNMQDMAAHGRVRHGESMHNSKFSNEDAITIISRVRRGELQKDLAAEFGVSPSTISSLVNGVQWSHVTGVKKPA